MFNPKSDEEKNDEELNTESSSSRSLAQQQAKMVQFGNTIHHRYTTNSNSAQPTTTTSQATSTPTNSSNSKHNEEEASFDEASYSKDRNIFLEQHQKSGAYGYDDDFHSSLDSSLTSSTTTKHSTSTSNFFTAAINKANSNHLSETSPRSSKSSPRISPRRAPKVEEQPAISENDEEYDEIEYLGQTYSSKNAQNVNQSVKTSSKYSLSNEYQPRSYDLKSFIDDSLSLSKDTNDSLR